MLRRVDAGPPKIYANTYLMGPKEGEKFAPQRFSNWATVTMGELLEDKVYDSEEAKQWCLELADKIKAEVKSKTSPKYKIAVQVHCFASEGQGMFGASGRAQSPARLPPPLDGGI